MVTRERATSHSADTASVAPNWDDVRLLLAVHHHGSLLGAAKSLSVATSTVSRRLEDLEARLGRTLVHRDRAGTRVDDDARGLLSLGEQMAFGLEALQRGPASELAGVVRLTAPDGFARPLVRVFAELHQRHPSLHLELSAESRMLDLSKREADIGLRLARTPTASLIEKPMGAIHFKLFAAPSYVARRLTTPRVSRREAERHDWVGLDPALRRFSTERWLRDYGARRFVLRSGSAAAVEEAVCAGLGLGVLSEAQGLSLGLVRIATERPLPSMEVYMAFHREARRTPRIRLVLEALEQALRATLVQRQGRTASRR